MQPRYAKVRSLTKARFELLPAFLLLSLLLVLLLP
jgi:Ser/Thr protein kinase RdoA (MazF antagonist)